ncbi:hypothetical protein V8G54_008861, partial [Vigna mungo]
VYLRNLCKTNFLTHVNTLLIDGQKQCIESTLFAWLLSFVVEVKMSRTLLSKLCSRRLQRRSGFQVRFVFIPFIKLDVCLGLRAIIHGEMFQWFTKLIVILGDCLIQLISMYKMIMKKFKNV